MSQQVWVRGILAGAVFAAVASWGMGRSAVFSNSQAPASTPQERIRTVAEARLGQPVEGRLSTQEAHRYSLRVDAGQFFRVELSQLTGDFELSLTDPAGQTTVTVNYAIGAIQPEVLTGIANAGGEFGLVVKVMAGTGRYRLDVREMRAATEADRRQVAADRLHLEALQLRGSKKLPEARRKIEEARQLYEQAIGAESPDLIKVLREEATIALALNDSARAESLYARQLAISEKAFGAAHLRTADALLTQGSFLLRTKEDYARAESSFRRSRKIIEEAAGPGNPMVVDSILNLASVHRNRNEYIEAEALLRQAIAIEMASDLPGGGMYASFNLGGFLATIGRYAEADVLFEQTQSILENLTDRPSPFKATIAMNRGMLSLDLGNPDRAAPFLETSKTMFAAIYGEESWQVAKLLALQARQHRDRKEFSQAEDLYRRALALRRKTLPPNHTDISASISGLAETLREEGKLDEALPLFEEAIRRNEDALGKESWEAGTNAANLARLRLARGEYAEAEKLAQRALRACEKNLGQEHPFSTDALDVLVSIYRATGRVPEAMEARQNALEINEAILRRNLFSGSDTENRNYLSRYIPETHDAVSLHTQHAPRDPAALRMAMTTLLRRKARALDTVAQGVRAMRERGAPEDRALLDRLQNQASALSQLLAQGAAPKQEAAYQVRVRESQAEMERIASSIGLRNVGFRARTQPVTIERVHAALPPGSALIEIFRHRPTDPKTRAELPGTYVAYVLRWDGKLTWARLGDQDRIDSAVAAWRAALSKRGKMDEHGPARAMEGLLMKPLRPLLSGVRHLIVSPDGALNLIPFAALENRAGHRLLEEFLISYVTSGRDLPQLGLQTPATGAPAILAGPDFNVATANGPAAESGTATRLRGTPPVERLASLPPFPPLAFASEEGYRIKALLPEARLYLGPDATEAVLKSLPRPGLLHLATHGFFLTEPDARSRAPQWPNPLLRSGLVLAGVNQRKSGGEDGIVTALELAALDLTGTKLVVLSACETSLGSIEAGEGVLGLTRALVLAGAESQLTALWRVDDEISARLMVDFYRRLLPAQGTGAGRAEALRQAQLTLLRDGVHQHPGFWAAFLPIGDWRPLAGARGTR